MERKKIHMSFWRNDSLSDVIFMFNWKDILFFIICGIGYFFLVKDYIPCLDDFRYARCYHNWENKIQSISDVFNSQIYHYQHCNGRFLVHCFVQLFCSPVLGLISFYICSSIVFVVFIMSVTYILRQQTYNELDKFLLLICLLTMMPQIGIYFFGSVAYTINYMWSSAIYVTFIAIYFSVKDENVYNAWQFVLLFIFGIICGSWQESFTIGIAGSLFLYHIITLKNTNRATLLLIIGFGIGAMLCIFSPGNISRAMSNGEGYDALGIYEIIQLFKHWSFFQCLIIITVLSIVIDLKRKSDFFIVDNWLFYGSIVLSFVFASIFEYHDLRQLTIVQVFSIILLLKFINQYILPYMENIFKNGLLRKFKLFNMIKVMCVLIYIYIYTVCIL